MLFNFKLLFRIAYRSLFHTRGTHARLTPKRLCVLLIIAMLYSAMEIASWLGFFLDNILFPGYRRQGIRQPVFIIGVPRSGTTFLHRLLERDEDRFTSLKSWEILFAPSVTQKKFFKALGALDRLCGGPLYWLLITAEKRLFKGLSSIHPASLFEAEEDAMILLHIFSSANAFFLMPFKEELWQYFEFDLEVSAAERGRIMAFYKRCVQNHLYVFGNNKQFLSKNPLFSVMVQSLDEAFPDAKFVYIARNPLEVVPSTISMLTYHFNVFLSPLTPYPFLDEQMEMLLKYYSYPLLKFTGLPESRQHTITYVDLIEKPVQTITQLYARFGIEINPAYAQVLHNEQESARRYNSRHAYSLENFGLTPEAIVKKYEYVFERFGFDRQL